MGLWGSESSLGWVLRDPVIWLDMPPLSLGQTLRECYGGKKQPAASLSDLKPHNNLHDKTNYF